mgnify:CR=1 FL=1
MKNIAYFLIPKNDVAYLYNDSTVRQGIEKMRFHGYSAIPVIDREGKYIRTISDGDFLGYVIDNGSSEYAPLDSIVEKKANLPVKITASIEELFDCACNQNFVPVTDDSGIFVGIVTRRQIIKYLVQDRNNASE